MKEIDIIKVMNKATMELKKEKGENVSLNERIDEYLRNEAFFYMLEKEDAIKLLITVGVHKEMLLNTYNKLVNKDVYTDLVNRNIISENDERILIKY